MIQEFTWFLWCMQIQCQKTANSQIKQNYLGCSIPPVALYQGSQTRGPRNYFVRPAAMFTNLKIFWIKTTCIIHFTRKKILFVLGPYLLTSMVLSRSLVTKLSVHVLDFSFQLQWEQCCVKQYCILWCGPPTNCYLPPRPTCWDEFETPGLGDPPTPVVLPPKWPTGWCHLFTYLL